MILNPYKFGSGEFGGKSFYHAGGAGSAADRYEIPNDSTLTPAGALTYSFWVKTGYTGSSTKNWIYKLTEFEIAIRFSQKIACRLFTDSSNRIGAQTGGGVTLNVWNHVAVVYTPSAADYTDIVIYFNGVAQTMSAYASAGTFTGMVNSSNPLVIGGDVELYEADFILFGKALSASEVGQVYNSGIPRDERDHFPSDIISYYSASNAVDGAGGIEDIGGNNNNDGTFEGGMDEATGVVEDYPS